MRKSYMYSINDNDEQSNFNKPYIFIAFVLRCATNYRTMPFTFSLRWPQAHPNLAPRPVLCNTRHTTRPWSWECMRFTVYCAAVHRMSVAAANIGDPQELARALIARATYPCRILASSSLIFALFLCLRRASSASDTYPCVHITYPCVHVTYPCVHITYPSGCSTRRAGVHAGMALRT